MGLAQLQQAVNALPAKLRAHTQTESLALGSGVVRGFLGSQWFERHVEGKGPRGIFTIDESEPVLRELSFLRIIDLAEVLYNLQHAPGFDECIIRMRHGDIEGTFAELDFGRLLYFNKRPFRFVVPQGIKKRDYDIEVLLPREIVACADAKCKIETTEFSDNGIRNVLNEARGQLPNDRPGIVFIKVPSRWMIDERFLSLAIPRARRFLGGVRRIVSVKYYASRLIFKDSIVSHDHAYKEVSNLKTDFGDGINWDIFGAIPTVPGRHGVPAHWQRILFFPDGVPR